MKIFYFIWQFRQLLGGVGEVFDRGFLLEDGGGPTPHQVDVPERILLSENSHMHHWSAIEQRKGLYTIQSVECLDMDHDYISVWPNASLLI